ncbi:MAG: ACT domain-containing protein [Clostridia bacterium]|nr:ACT domain-containing protein [Clostridia bacterium]
MNSKKLYIITEEILTDGMKKTLLAKELLESSKAKSISEATRIAGLSRAAFYRYKDSIHKMASSVSDIISIMLILEDKSGVLSNVLNQISMTSANILTINQEIPLSQKARVSIYIEIKDMKVEAYELLNSLERIEGVIKAELADGGK